MLRIDGAQFTNKDIKSEFRQFLFDVADANKKSEQIKSVKCFVLLVYDDTNPYLKKVLKDDDFWSALDKLTKDRLAVITYGENEYTSPPAPLQIMMKGMSPQLNAEETSMLFEKALGQKIIKRELPCLLVFSWDNKASEASFGHLNLRSVDEAYDVLRILVGGLGKALMELEENQLSHPREIVEFATDHLDRNISGLEMRQFLKGKSWMLSLARFFVGHP